MNEECIVGSGYNVDLLVIKYNKRITLPYKAYKYLIFWLRLLIVNFNRYDLVYVNIPPFAWACFLNPTYIDSKTINHWHGDEAVIDTLFLRLTRRLVIRMTRKCIHIAPSQYFKRVLCEDLNINANNIIVSPSGGVDINTFSCSNQLSCEKEIVIGFSSGMSKGKGSDLIMELINKAEYLESYFKRKVIFKIIEYGNDMHLYKKSLMKSTNVELIPKMHKNKMPKFYGSIDLLLMTSRRKSESLGLVVLEAMSCGKPVVSFNMFAFPEFVISGLSGELVDFSNDNDNNVKGFIIAIKKIVNLYNNYRPRDIVVEKYSKEYVINQYKEIL